MRKLVVVVVAFWEISARAEIYNRPAGPYNGDDSPNPCRDVVRQGVDLVYQGQVKLNESIRDGIALMAQGAELIGSCPLEGNPCAISLSRGLDLINTGRAFVEAGSATIPNGLANIDAGRQLARSCRF